MGSTLPSCRKRAGAVLSAEAGLPALTSLWLPFGEIAVGEREISIAEEHSLEAMCFSAQHETLWTWETRTAREAANG